MLRIVVVDQSAEARSQLTRVVTSAFETHDAELTLLPQISLKSLTFEELRFHGAADIVILGSELVQKDLTLIGTARKMLPDIPFIVRLPEQFARLTIIEQVARFGADDVWLPSTTASEALRKIIILSRRSKTAKTGRLILVDSGKGGAGCTSLVAALGESLAAQGRTTVVVDGDCDTQDLTRFLQVRPFVSENLQQLIDGHRPLTQESVEQCITKVWSDFPNLFCLPPPPDGEKLLAGAAAPVRLFLSVLELLDSLFQCIVVDVGSARGALLRTLYRVSDCVIFPVSNDPAALFVAADRISRARAQIAPDSEIKVVNFLSDSKGMSPSVLRDELIRAARLSEQQFSSAVIPTLRDVARWPASGTTPYGCGGRAVRKAVELLCMELGLVEGNAAAAQQKRIGYERLKALEAPAARSIQLPPPTANPLQQGALRVDDLVEPAKVQATDLVGAPRVVNV